MFIAIDGHGGSGKSTLAAELAEKLDAQVVHTDDFASWDNPKNWWVNTIDQVFKPIVSGIRTLSYERSKWWENHHPEPVVNDPVSPIMILEGVSASREEFRRYISLSIFVDTPKEVCLMRGFERDQGNDGKSDQEIKEMWIKWYRDEENFFVNHTIKANADIVIDGTKPFKYQI